MSDEIVLIISQIIVIINKTAQKYAYALSGRI